MGKIIALSFLLGLVGCATADWSQLTDATTTAIAMEAGFSEGNPLFYGAGWPAIAAVKLGVTQGVKLLPGYYCEYSLFGLTVTGFGAALWNIGVMLGSGPAAIPFAAGAIWGFWDRWLDHASLDCAMADQTMRGW